jgi:hypothetical protein
VSSTASTALFRRRYQQFDAVVRSVQHNEHRNITGLGRREPNDEALRMRRIPLAFGHPRGVGAKPGNIRHAAFVPGAREEGRP